MATANVTEETVPTTRTPTLMADFRAFLDKYSVIGLAIAFVIGLALTQLIQAIVKGLLMPTVAPLFAALGDDWRVIETYVGPFGPYLIGDVIYNVVYFVIIAGFVFLVAKLLLREKEVVKR